MVPNRDNVVITKQPQQWFNPEIHRTKPFEDKTTSDSHVARKKNKFNRSVNPVLPNAVLNPTSGQCVLFKPEAQNVDKLGELVNKYVPSSSKSFVRANISQVLNSSSLNEKQKAALSNLIPTSRPQHPELLPQHFGPPSVIAKGRGITKKQELFFVESPNLCKKFSNSNSKWKSTEKEATDFTVEFWSIHPLSFRGILKQSNNKAFKSVQTNGKRVQTNGKRVKFCWRNVHYLPKLNHVVQIDKEMRFPPISKKIPERYPYDVIRAPDQLWKINEDFFRNNY